MRAASAAVTAQDEEDALALRVFLLQEAGEFSHESHLRVARLYLTQLPLGAAIDRFTLDLQMFAEAQSAAQKFHATMTVMFLLLLKARLAGAQEDETFDAFIARNEDLTSKAVLSNWYSAELLAQPRARREFVMPDRAPGQVAPSAVG